MKQLDHLIEVLKREWLVNWLVAQASVNGGSDSGECCVSLRPYRTILSIYLILFFCSCLQFQRETRPVGQTSL